VLSAGTFKAGYIMILDRKQRMLSVKELKYVSIFKCDLLFSIDPHVLNIYSSFMNSMEMKTTLKFS
jgi:hypothetical protein